MDESGTAIRAVPPVSVAELVVGIPAGSPCGRENWGWLPADVMLQAESRDDRRWRLIR